MDAAYSDDDDDYEYGDAGNNDDDYDADDNQVADTHVTDDTIDCGERGRDAGYSTHDAEARLPLVWGAVRTRLRWL